MASFDRLQQSFNHEIGMKNESVKVALMKVCSFDFVRDLRFTDPMMFENLI
jgi:hypothetical protein